MPVAKNFWKKYNKIKAENPTMSPGELRRLTHEAFGNNVPDETVRKIKRKRRVRVPMALNDIVTNIAATNEFVEKAGGIKAARQLIDTLESLTNAFKVN